MGCDRLGPCPKADGLQHHGAVRAPTEAAANTKRGPSAGGVRGEAQAFHGRALCHHGSSLSPRSAA